MFVIAKDMRVHADLVTPILVGLVVRVLVVHVIRNRVAKGKTVQQFVNDDRIKLELLLIKKVSLDIWIQLLGMIGVIASLVFVGLQMR